MDERNARGFLAGAGIAFVAGLIAFTFLNHDDGDPKAIEVVESSAVAADDAVVDEGVLALAE